MNKKTNTIRFSGVVINIFFVCLSLIFIAPLLLVISISLTPEVDIINFGYSFFPRNISLLAYQITLANPIKILNAYKVSAIVSFGGTILSLFFSAAFAYSVSRKSFNLGKVFNIIIIFTMLFQGGLVPFYILVTNYLHLQDTYAILILALFGNPFYIIMLRTFFKEIPESLVEAAYIDGAKDIRVFLTIFLPLSKPILTTVGMLTLYSYWNDWYNALLFINNSKLVPLQYLLQMIMSLVSIITENAEKVGNILTSGVHMPTEGVRMAMVVVTTGPMFLAFIFLQKYFSRGVTLGAVKG